MKVLTFDIEDWFHILHKYPDDILDRWDNYEVRIHKGMDKIFRVLLDNNIKATFFVVGYIVRKHPEIIKRIDELGFEIGAHSDMHRVAYRQTPKEFNDDLIRCIKSIEDSVSKKVISYRAPGFSVKEENLWVFELLNKLGIQYDSSIFPAKREDGGFERFMYNQPSIIKGKDFLLREFPMSVNSFLGHKFTVTGGGYFRFFPYRMTKKLMNNSNYTMTYFHPRDFDPDQPILEGLNFLRRFKSYFNLHKSYVKLKQLVYDFDFTDIQAASKKIDWNNAPVFEIE